MTKKFQNRLNNYSAKISLSEDVVAFLNAPLDKKLSGFVSPFSNNPTNQHALRWLCAMIEKEIGKPIPRNPFTYEEYNALAAIENILSDIANGHLVRESSLQIVAKAPETLNSFAVQFFKKSKEYKDLIHKMTSGTADLSVLDAIALRSINGVPPKTDREVQQAKFPKIVYRMALRGSYERLREELTLSELMYAPDQEIPKTSAMAAGRCLRELSNQLAGISMHIQLNSTDSAYNIAR